MIKNGKEMLKAIPEKHRKAWIIGGIGAAVGGGIGGYLSAVNGNYLYAGFGAAIGGVLGDLLGLMIGHLIRFDSLKSLDYAINSVLGSICIIFVISGIYVFIVKGEWIGLVGAIFFGLCGLIYFWRIRFYK